MTPILPPPGGGGGGVGVWCVILLQKNIRRYNIPMAQFLTLAQKKKTLAMEIFYEK